LVRHLEWKRTFTVLAALSLAPCSAYASPYSTINAAAVHDPVTVERLRGGIAILTGSGGNISVLVGTDGSFMVDAGIAVSRQKIETALKSLDSGMVRFVVNTHWHWDHADGNAWLRASGATIIADPHTIGKLSRTVRVEEWEHTFPPIPKASLPTDALPRDRVMHFGGEGISIRHYRPGHTDGDLSVYFWHADVLATGDTFWNGMYPFIDYIGGGSIDGAIRAANENLALAGENTQVIPGHGPLGDRAQLTEFRDMLVSVRARVAALKSKGQSESDVVAAKPTSDLDGKWGQALISGDLFTRLVYRGV